MFENHVNFLILPPLFIDPEDVFVLSFQAFGSSTASYLSIALVVFQRGSSTFSVTSEAVA